ncbi:MAG: hypothetical protein JWM80_5643 [Cyanobacteria bacterium RYN_339]|nr:hypothetical protein [Cyanobacteria bacterium RYN_339]
MTTMDQPILSEALDRRNWEALRGAASPDVARELLARLGALEAEQYLDPDTLTGWGMILAKHGHAGLDAAIAPWLAPPVARRVYLAAALLMGLWGPNGQPTPAAVQALLEARRALGADAEGEGLGFMALCRALDHTLPPALRDLLVGSLDEEIARDAARPELAEAKRDELASRRKGA